MGDRNVSVHKKLQDFHAKFKGAKKSGINPHFNSEHFTLEDIVHATTPVLNEVGLHVVHYLADGHLITSIFDEDGLSVASHFALPHTANPQAVGSAITYAKRYNLCALLNIAEADDDGNAAATEAVLHPIDVEPMTTKQWAELEEWKEAGMFSESVWRRISAAADSMTADQANKIIERARAKQK